VEVEALEDIGNELVGVAVSLLGPKFDVEEVIGCATELIE
jgi:hypothetical protein